MSSLSDHNDRLTRVWRPEPTVAFGRLDRLRPGYERAKDVARAHGFGVVEREPGGHAAAYGRGSLVIEEEGDGDLGGIHARFERAAATLVGALIAEGVDARLGPVPSEYCPGDYSVNIGGRRKIAGLAQRVRGKRYLLGINLTVSDAADVKSVLADVYEALALPFEPDTVGEVGLPIEAVAEALRRAYSAV